MCALNAKIDKLVSKPLTWSQFLVKAKQIRPPEVEKREWKPLGFLYDRYNVLTYKFLRIDLPKGEFEYLPYKHFQNFEAWYWCGVYSKSLFGWILKCKKFLGEFESYELYWNLNNLLDKETGKFIGIDGGGLGLSCGLLENLRERPNMSLADKCEFLVYLFVAELNYAVYYTNFIVDLLDAKSGSSEFSDYDFPDTDCRYDLPYGYNWRESEQWGHPGDHREIGDNWQSNLFPHVYLDKYITSRAEWEVFLFFARVWVAITAFRFVREDLDNWSTWFTAVMPKETKAFLFFGIILWKIWARFSSWLNFFKYLLNLKDIPEPLQVVNSRRHNRHNMSLALYHNIYLYGKSKGWAEILVKEQEGIGRWWKVKMRVKVVYWSFVYENRRWFRKLSWYLMDYTKKLYIFIHNFGVKMGWNGKLFGGIRWFFWWLSRKARSWLEMFCDFPLVISV